MSKTKVGPTDVTEEAGYCCLLAPLNLRFLLLILNSFLCKLTRRLLAGLLWPIKIPARGGTRQVDSGGEVEERGEEAAGGRSGEEG